MNITTAEYKNRYRVIILVFMAGLLQGLTLVSFPALSSVLKTTLSLTDTAYGAIFLPQVALTAAGAVAGGLLSRRFGLPALLRLSLLANGLSQLALLVSVGMGGSSGFSLVALGTSFLGLGFGLSAAPLNRYPILFFPAKPDSALTALHTFIGAGLAIGPFAAGMLVEMGYWEAFPAGLAMLALFILALSLPLPLHFPADSVETTSGAMVETRVLLCTPAFWLLFSVAAVYAVCCSIQFCRISLFRLFSIDCRTGIVAVSSTSRTGFVINGSGSNVGRRFGQFSPGCIA